MALQVPNAAVVGLTAPISSGPGLLESALPAPGPSLFGPPPPRAEDGADRADEPVLFVLSARSDLALRRVARRWAVRLREPGARLGDLAHTAAVGRPAFAHRLSLVPSSATEAAAAPEGTASDAKSND